MSIRTSRVQLADHRATKRDRAVVRNRLPSVRPDLWMTRAEAAETLGVHERTVDRYIRQHRLTSYVGPMPEAAGLAHRVMVWKEDVDWTLVGEHNRGDA